MKGNIELDRRKVLGTVGGLAMAGSGLAALTGSAAAGDAKLEGPSSAVTATTDDGQIKYVAYGGRLRFSWDGLDTEATYGEYITESRVKDAGGNWSGWRHHGAGSGPLGEGTSDGNNEFEEGEQNTSNTWGGDNDSNSGPGSEGYFQFKFGSPYGQNDYAIAYDDAGDLSGVHPVKNPWTAQRFEAATDGGTQTTVVQIRMTCRIYDGDPSDSNSSVLVADNDVASMKVTVDNRPATGTTGGEISGSVGADES